MSDGITLDYDAERELLTAAISHPNRVTFNALLGQVKTMPGRRWNPDTKAWEFPAEWQTAQRLRMIAKPHFTPRAQEWLAAAAADAETALASNLPDDAEVDLPWADRLFPHQRAAVAFLVDNPKAIIADEMGLGKTAEAISAAAAANASRVLVIAPNAVLKNWEKEIYQWAGEDEPITLISGKTKVKRNKQLAEAEKAGGWTIINWEKIRLLPELAKIEWDAVIADEAHRAKNRKAQQTKALWKLQAPMQLALTGTPIQNEPSELWSLLKWLDPKKYRGYWNFFNLYVDYYEGHFGRIITGVKNPEALRFELSPYLIRRMKSQVLDLPEKIRTFLRVEMDPYQRKMYDEATKALWLEILEEAEAGDPEALELLADPTKLLLPNGAARTIRLRQIADSPALLGGTDKSGKLDAAVEIIADAPPNKKFVVFVQFRDAVTLINERLTKRGIGCLGLTGDTPVDRTMSTPEDVLTRQEMVDQFQDPDSEVRVLVMTQAAGGVGLTLTAADTCIFVDRDWVPANNEQAEDRLHRIGQKNNVQVIILMAEDSVDDGTILVTNQTKELIVGSVIATEEIKNEWARRA